MGPWSNPPALQLTTASTTSPSLVVSYDGANESFEYGFSTDGRENSSIHQGKAFKTKAKWDGDVLRVTTTENGSTTTERFSQSPDGSLMLVVERPEHRPVTLFFQRQ